MKKIVQPLLVLLILICFCNCEKNKVDPVVDLDGNVYKTVIIGSQEWFAEDLKTTKYNDGTSIPLVTGNSAWGALSTPAYCWYDNNEAVYKGEYGALYNWYAVETGKLCPDGWHVSTDSDWKQLEMFLGMSQSDADKEGFFRGTNEGGKLKESGTTHWEDSSEGATNETGFTAVAGGLRHYNGVLYDDIGYGVNYWCSNECDNDLGWRRYIHYSDDDIWRDCQYKRYGFSVRCIKD